MPRTIHAWTLDKLKLLELYLQPYLQATTNARDRIYIDGFAGPGLNLVEETGEVVDGSPLIALDAKAQSNVSRFTQLFFIERDRDAAGELSATVESRDTEGRATVIAGDVNEELPKIVERFHRTAPIFVFLDTAPIEPKWSTIEAIAPWRTELLINFPLGMSINRNPDSPRVTDYFGTDAWRPLWDRRDDGGLLALYKTRLAELGYIHQQEADRLITTEPGTGGKRLYYLIPASKHPAAERIWEWVFKQPDAAGQAFLRFDD